MKKFRRLVLPGLVFFSLWPVNSILQAQTFYTISTNGPATNRVNLVFFSEGYTSGELGQFLSDVTNVSNYFFTAEPYSEYSNYFNIYAIAVSSAHSGSTHLGYTTYNNGYTYFNSSYIYESDLITIPPNSVDGNYNHGQGKIDSLLKTYLPATNNDLAALLVNDTTFGGSDNGGKVAITSVYYDNLILLHESGHTLGNLGDEYTTPYPGFPDTEEPNTTTQTNLALIKWRAWIPAGTPIPTPPTTDYQDQVGLFEGAHYHSTGWYRPTESSRMQSLSSSDGFGPVNSEALVLAIYAKVRPLTSHLPAANSLTITSGAELTFSVNLLEPASQSVIVQWHADGMIVNGATNSVFQISPSQLGNGTHHIEADVFDATTFVRTDLKNLLKQTNVWTLAVTLPALHLDSFKRQPNGDFSFRVAGNSPDAVVVEDSTNLLNWNPLKTNLISSGHFFFTNSGAELFDGRFYRAVTPP